MKALSGLDRDLLENPLDLNCTIRMSLNIKIFASILCYVNTFE